MKYLDVRLRQPDWMLHPMQRFIRDGDVVRYEELQSWNVAGRTDAVEYELFYVEAEREPYVAALEEVQSVRWFEVEPIDEASFYCYCCQETREEDETWREAFTDLHLVVVPPIVYDADATFYLTVVGDGDALQAMLDGLPPDVEADVQQVGTYDRKYAPLLQDLTERQLEALEVAVDLGFFAVPREATVADVADALACAESTAATHLQKAQARLVRRVTGRLGRRRVDASSEP